MKHFTGTIDGTAWSMTIEKTSRPDRLDGEVRFIRSDKKTGKVIDKFERIVDDAGDTRNVRNYALRIARENLA